MKQLLSTPLLVFVLCLSFTSRASAQVVDVNAPIQGASSDQLRREPARSTTTNVASPLAENLKLSYYNSGRSTYGWLAPIEFTPLLFISYGQRMTLPGDRGFVDSARVRIGATLGDSIIITLIRDTLFEVSNGQFFHLINIFAPETEYARVTVAVKDTMPGGWLTARFDHVEVEQHFFVAVDPTINDAGQATSSFELIGDSSDAAPQSTENSRSAFLAITPENQYLSALLDGIVQFAGDESAAYSNLYIEAFVEVASGSVNGTTSTRAAVYPNPATANALLRVSHEELISSISIRNMLGAEVLAWSGKSSQVELPTVALPKGVYQLFITTESGVTTEKVFVN